MTDNQNTWFKVWFEPEGFQTHRAEDYRDARREHDRIRGGGLPLHVQLEPLRPGDPPALRSPEPFRRAWHDAAPASAWRSNEPLKQHPFISDLQVSRKGDIFYRRRELQPRQSRIPIAGMSSPSQGVDRFWPWLVCLRDPAPALAVDVVDHQAIDAVPTLMSILPVELLVIETHGTLAGDPADVRRNAWQAWIDSILANADNPSTPQDTPGHP